MLICFLALFVFRTHLPSRVCGDVGPDLRVRVRECRSRAVGSSLCLEDAVWVCEVSIAGCVWYLSLNGERKTPHFGSCVGRGN